MLQETHFDGNDNASLMLERLSSNAAQRTLKMLHQMCGNLQSAPGEHGIATNMITYDAP